MKTPVRILIGTVAGFLIVAAGVSLGLHYKFGQTNVAARSVDPSDSSPNFNTYDISPPSRGALLETLDIPLVPVQNGADVILEKTNAAAIRTGQRVLLYDAGNTLLETLGTVSLMDEGRAPPGKILIHLDLNGDRDVSVESVVRGRIVTGRKSDVQRLPLTALVKDGTGLPYLWETHKNEDGTRTVYYKRATVTALTDEFVVIDQPSPGDNIYVLNPDSALRDGQKINTRETLFSASPQTDVGRIEALMKDRNNPYRQIIKEVDASLTGKMSAPPPPGLPHSLQGCAQTESATDAFIKEIKTLSTPKQPQASQP